MDPTLSANRNKILSIILCLFCASVFAQKTEEEIGTKNDNLAIINYDDYFTTRLSFSDNFNSFRLKDRAGNSEFLISPNQQINTTLSLAYRFLEVDLGYTPTFLRFNKDDDIKGKTKFFNLGTRFYVGKFMQNIQYRNTKGFYIDAFDFPELGETVFSDLKVVKYGGSTSYIFNPDFSFRAVYKQNEWQTKSAGSFVPSLSYYWTRISDKDPEKDTFFDITLGPSYYYNWIIQKQFMVSLGAHAGLGYNRTKFGFSDGTPSKITDGLTYTTELKLALGYNADRFFTGVNVTIDSFHHNDEPEFRVDDQQQFFELYLGYRFNAPKKLIEGTDYIEKKIPGKKKDK